MKTKFFFLILCLISICSSFIALSLFHVTAETETVTRIEPKVYITDTGNYYHSIDCHYLRSVNPIGLYQAQEDGYSACSYCKGKPNGYITVTYYPLEDTTTPPTTSNDTTNNAPTTNNTSNDSDGRSTFWIIFFVVVGIVFIFMEFIAPTISKKK